MEFSRPTRPVLSGLCLVLLGGLVSSRPVSSEAARSAAFDDRGEPVLAESTLAAQRTPPDPLEETPDVATTAGPGTHAGPLTGLPGAATALAIKDYPLALKLVDSVEATEGSDTWFRVGALKGRALRLRGESKAAIETLEPLWGHRRLDRNFPKDYLGRELAEAHLEYARAGGLSAGDADDERRKAIRILDRARKHPNLRNLAELRVLQAQAMLEIQGTSAVSTSRAARKAAAAAGKVLKDYPNHPRAGDLWVQQALAMERSGKPTDAMAELRTIHIERAGWPESADAWKELQRVAGTQRKVRHRPLSVNERLRMAQAARSNRWVELSRRLLDEIIDDPDTSTVRRKEARSSRSWTAYKQRDFKRCADDLRPMFKDSGNLEIRARLLRCLERGGMYREAVDIWLDYAKTKKRGTKASALWEAAELAFRGGLYEEANKILAKYGKLSRAHRETRAFYDAWIPMRLNQHEEAINKLAQLERFRSQRTRARYFRGKLLLATGDESGRKEGEQLLRTIVKNDPLNYYGLIARQRLKDAGVEPPPPPVLDPVEDEARHPTRQETSAKFAALDADFGESWPMIRRGRQLYDAGYIEEARREVRIASQAYLTAGKKASGVRNESFYKGLGWKASWSHPRIVPTRSGRKHLRDRDLRDRLRLGLRELSRGVDEPYRIARLSTSEDGAFKARWHPRAYRWAVEREARLQNIDPIHMWSLMYTESRFRRFVVSPVGARGALQIMPWTGRQLVQRMGELENGRFDNDSLFDIDTNAHLSAYYVAELLKKFHGQAPMAYASYNGGPSNVARWLAAKSKTPGGVDLDEFVEEIAFSESNRYARRVTEVSAAYALMYRGELPTWTNKVDPKFEDNIDF